MYINDDQIVYVHPQEFRSYLYFTVVSMLFKRGIKYMSTMYYLGVQLQVRFLLHRLLKIRLFSVSLFKSIPFTDLPTLRHQIQSCWHCNSMLTHDTHNTYRSINVFHFIVQTDYHNSFNLYIYTHYSTHHSISVYFKFKSSTFAARLYYR